MPKISSKLKNIKLVYVVVVLVAYLKIFAEDGYSFQTKLNIINNLNCSQLNPDIANPRNLECIKRQNLKTVQLLTDFFHFKNWNHDELGQKPFENCQFEKKCYAFKYISEFQTPLEQSDGVLVHIHDLVNMPKRNSYYRNPSQLWSFFTHEPQRLSYCNFNGTITDLDGWFNLSHTIKSEASYFAFNLNRLDTTWEYIIAYIKDSYSIPTKSVLHENKNKLAVWFVSRCSTPNKRELFVKELAKYISIDIYGKCGSKQDPCGNSSNPQQCLTQLYNSYKFYLSFENCNCDSYVTEKYYKFYRPDSLFKINLVPIVMGARIDQYDKIAPISENGKHSFIHVESFQSNAKKLAEYLLYLDRNETAYTEYFQWKYDLYRKLDVNKWFFWYYILAALAKPHYKTPFCDLCEHLHDRKYLQTQREGLKISEYFNFIKDCDVSNENDNLTFDSLKNKCYYFGLSNSDIWKL